MLDYGLSLISLTWVAMLLLQNAVSGFLDSMFMCTYRNISYICYMASAILEHVQWGYNCTLSKRRACFRCERRRGRYGQEKEATIDQQGHRQRKQGSRGTEVDRWQPWSLGHLNHSKMRLLLLLCNFANLGQVRRSHTRRGRPHHLRIGT